MKIAFQLTGQIRFWEYCSQHWNKFKSDLEKNGFDVDMHICSWKDNYTEKIKFDFFTTDNLIPINYDLLKDNTLTDKHRSSNQPGRRGQHGIDLFPISYIQYWGGRYRRLYQKENNIEYDFIILSRPDFCFDVSSAGILSSEEKSFSNYKNLKEEISKSHCTIFIPHGVRNSIGFKPNMASRFSSDLWCVGTEESINLYCNGFLHSYLQESKSFKSSAHTYPAMTCMKTNLHTQPIHMSGEFRREN